MLVIYWSPVSGQTCTTSNMIAAATMMALDYQMKILVTHTQGRKTLVENAYDRLRVPERMQGIAGSMGGMDAVVRLYLCEMLTPQGLRDNTESIMKDRLDLLAGTEQVTEEEWLRSIPHIIHSAKQQYDVIFVDIGSGMNNSVTRLYLELADQIVVNLNQNVSLLSSVYDKANGPESIIGKGRRAPLYCLGSFDRRSKYSVDRISKAYRIPMKNIGIVPRNTRFMDALLDQDVVDFLLRAMAIKKGLLEYNEEAEWVRAIRRFDRRLMQVLELSPAAGVTSEDA
jgi:hypothetical protein